MRGCRGRLVGSGRCLDILWFGQQEHLLLGNARLVLVIGTHDALHQMVTHHVAFVEVDER